MNAKLPTLDEMVTRLGRQFDSLPDSRAGPNLTYTLRDAGLYRFHGVFHAGTVLFSASTGYATSERPQRATRPACFGSGAFPSDAQVRDLLDPRCWPSWRRRTGRSLTG